MLTSSRVSYSNTSVTTQMIGAEERHFHLSLLEIMEISTLWSTLQQCVDRIGSSPHWTSLDDSTVSSHVRRRLTFVYFTYIRFGRNDSNSPAPKRAGV